MILLVNYPTTGEVAAVPLLASAISLVRMKWPVDAIIALAVPLRHGWSPSRARDALWHKTHQIVQEVVLPGRESRLEESERPVQ